MTEVNDRTTSLAERGVWNRLGSTPSKPHGSVTIFFGYLDRQGVTPGVAQIAPNQSSDPRYPKSNETTNAESLSTM